MLNTSPIRVQGGSVRRVPV